MRTTAEIRARRSIIHTAIVRREWHLEDELEIRIVAEPADSPCPARSAGIVPRRLRRPEFPRLCGGPPFCIQEDTDV